MDEILNNFRNYPQTAWQNLKQNGGVAPTAGDYISRTDDADRSIPHVCFKVPTGGGKTLLAASALERLHRQRGLTLWIVPTKAIYAQTKAALWDKQRTHIAKCWSARVPVKLKYWKKRMPSIETISPITSVSCSSCCPRRIDKKVKNSSGCLKIQGSTPVFSPIVTTSSAMHACKTNTPISNVIQKGVSS